MRPKACRYDLVWAARRDSFAALRPKLRENCPHAPVVFDTVDLHLVREQRTRAWVEQHRGQPEVLQAVLGTAGRERWLGELDAADGTAPAEATSKATALELDLIREAAAVVVVSDAEADEVARRVPWAPRAHVISNIHALEPTATPFAARRGALFVGNFNHPPNRDAILWFVRDILPLVHPRVPDDFVFHVVGANAIPPEIIALHEHAIGGVYRVAVHGYVDDLRPLYASARVAVQPLRWGAGVKGKVNAAMKTGLPSVCTPIAVEGMSVVNGTHALVAETAAAFADRVVGLYGDEPLWRRLVEGGYANVAANFSVGKAVAGLAEVLTAVRGSGPVTRALAVGSRNLKLQPDHRQCTDEVET